MIMMHLNACKYGIKNVPVAYAKCPGLTKASRLFLTQFMYNMYLRFHHQGHYTPQYLPHPGPHLPHPGHCPPLVPHHSHSCQILVELHLRHSSYHQKYIQYIELIAQKIFVNIYVYI